MLVAERYQQIMALLKQKGSMRVTELAKYFNVTEETIRRDFYQLEKQNKIVRSHGGAVLKEEPNEELFYFEREIKHVHEKKAIAEKAIEFIKPNEKIILDASTTAWYIAKNVPNISLTVLTNSIKVAMELSEKDEITVVSIGGTLSPRSLSYVGPLAQHCLSFYHVDKVFLSCQGIHEQHGLSDSNEWQALVKKSMINIADESFLLADYSKFGVRSFAKITGMQDIHHLITDTRAAPGFTKSVEEIGINVFTV